MNDLDFAGNKKVLERLGVLLDSGRFPHALIIEGETGLGKATLARQLAAALVCRSESKPCMKCSQCRKALEGFHPDIYTHIASGGANSFHVDTVRDIIRDVYMQPNEAEHKVYILGNADCMNASAQNAMLKVLEEPPGYVIFILTVTSKSRMLETVLSRSVTVSLEGVNAHEGADYITARFPELGDYFAVKSVLASFNGNIGRAIEQLRSEKSSDAVCVCREICKSLVDESEYELLKACAAFQKDRQLIAASAELLKNIFRDALVLKKGGQTISGQDDAAAALKTRLTAARIMALMDVCDRLRKMALMNLNNSLLITKICYSLREAAGR